MCGSPTSDWVVGRRRCDKIHLSANSVCDPRIENPTDNQQQDDLNPDKAGHERVVTASQMIGSIVHHDFFS